MYFDYEGHQVVYALKYSFSDNKVEAQLLTFIYLIWNMIAKWQMECSNLLIKHSNIETIAVIVF